MKELHTLFGIVHYEGHYLLGVYSTKEKAEQALKDFDNNSLYFDDFIIKACALDEAAAYQ